MTETRAETPRLRARARPSTAVAVLGAGRVAGAVAAGGADRIPYLTAGSVNDLTAGVAGDSAYSAIVVVSRGRENASQRAVQEYASARRTPWLPVHLGSGWITIGPLVRPPRPGCPLCVRRRRNRNRQDTSARRLLRERLESTPREAADSMVPPMLAAAVARLVRDELDVVPDGPGAARTDGAILRRVLDVIRSDPGATYGAVAERLAFAGDAATVDRLLTTLIDGGLVERCPPFSDQTADALPRLVNWMARALPDPTGEPARLLESLRAINEAVEAYALHPAERKRHWRADADRLAERLASAETGSGSRLPPPRLMHESYVLAGTAVSWPSASLRPMHDDLNRVRRFLAPLDPSLPLKIALADYFLQVYGPAGSVPFLTFYRRIHDMEPRPGTSAERAVRRFLEVAPRPLGSGAGRVRDRYGPRVARLGELRRTFWEVLHAAQEKAGEGNSMPTAVLDELMTSWPRFVRPAASISVYGQVMTTSEGPHLVVNGVVQGYGPDPSSAGHRG